MDYWSVLIVVVIIAAWVGAHRVVKRGAVRRTQACSVTAPPVANTEQSAPAEPDYLLFVDLETTGLDPSSDRITEICFIRLAIGQQQHKVLCSLINPGRPIPRHITDLTGITDEMVRDMPSEQDILPQFFDFIGRDRLYAYNADFDLGFLRAAAKRLGREFDNEGHCVLEALRQAHPNLRSYKLADACSAFGLQVATDAHRAQGDALRAIELWCALGSDKSPAPGYLRPSYQANRADWDDDDKDYVIYGHINPAGECFYIWTAREGDAETPDKDTLWHYYVEEMLHGQYEIQLLDDELSYSRARAKKEQLLKRHARTVLNRANQWRKHDLVAQDRYRALGEQIEALLQAGKLAQKERPDEALASYHQALALAMEQLDIKLEQSLFGEVDRAYGKAHRCMSVLKALDRMTLVLCQSKLAADADTITSDVLARYPGVTNLSGFEAIRKRIAKGLSKSAAQAA